jgi:hypothetical protein
MFFVVHQLLDVLYTQKIRTGLSLNDLKFLAWQWHMDFSQDRELMIPVRVDLALRYKEVDIDTQILQQLATVDFFTIRGKTL